MFCLICPTRAEQMTLATWHYPLGPYYCRAFQSSFQLCELSSEARDHSAQGHSEGILAKLMLHTPKHFSTNYQWELVYKSPSFSCPWYGLVLRHIFSNNMESYLVALSPRVIEVTGPTAHPLLATFSSLSHFSSPTPSIPFLRSPLNKSLSLESYSQGLFLRECKQCIFQ